MTPTASAMRQNRPTQNDLPFPTDYLVVGDGLAMMRDQPAASADMIFADLPYGMTECTWDKPIPLEAFWAAVRHVAKPNAAIVMTAMQPFASAVIVSNPKMFRCEWIWTDGRPTGSFNANIHPLRVHESVLVFGLGKVNYYPQMWESGIRKSSPGGEAAAVYKRTERTPYKSEGSRFPTTLIDIPMPAAERGRHPTQKPLALLDYLIRTYTRPGDLVLDPCIGSGSAMVAAMRAGRHFIGCDSEIVFVEAAKSWLAESFTVSMFGG